MSIPIKNDREIEKMRVACRAASEILDRVSELVRPGMTTGEVDQAAADFMRELGLQERLSRLPRLSRAISASR